ncbi:helix-turn-helix transcriptional regulator [Corynebacterium sp. Marseille-P4321]|uniref:helix-turn-helix domain-containing protein n=1 Tax=Corynebacterium sp. Marseille-P4321 TaxID=2736603 RepID=UPI000B22A4F7|nr:helix-turn-helix transcriptional regulator [Corynebacterium sp. Marseille-P4321]
MASSDSEPQVVCHLDRLMAQRGITGAALAQEVGITPVNLSVLKNNRAKAVRFSTLAAICQALDCQPGDVFSVEH